MRLATHRVHDLLHDGHELSEKDESDFHDITGDLLFKIEKLRDEVAKLQPDFESQEVEQFQKRLVRAA
jgi:hypothetical protein